MPRISDPFIRQDYRGLNDAEDDLLRTYLRQRSEPIESLETQLTLGPGEQLPDFQPDEFRRQWRESSKFKLDAIVERPGSFELIELKDFIRTSSLGQVLSYRYWFEVERTVDKPIELWVTAPDINPSSVQPHQFHNVNVHIQTQEGREHLQQGLQASPPFED